LACELWPNLLVSSPEWVARILRRRIGNNGYKAAMIARGWKICPNVATRELL